MSILPLLFFFRFDRDFCWRTGARLLPIHCESSNNFKLTSSALQSALDNARNSNIPVKGVLIANPSNPLGTTMDRSALETLLQFTNTHRLHLICDEIFAGTVFASPPFISIAEILLSHSTADPNLIHIVSSLSKNLGLPGFRVGLIYSYNDAVVACARKMSSFNLVSTQTQRLLAAMLADDDFLTDYLEENARRLWNRRELFVGGLRRVGIRCLEGNGGLFCWMDLRAFLKERSQEGELKLWRAIVHDVKLNVSPGSSFHCNEPGWFRVCFANMDDETTEVALRRIRMFVDRESEEEEKQAKKKKMRYLKEAGLRLSLPRRFEELAAMTPRLSSPRSPLVKATT